MKKFKKIYIEITNRCNLSCRFCPPSQRAPAFMNAATFAEILRRISAHTDHLALHVLGEPLLHPDLEQLLAHCQSHGLRVNLTTNGRLLTARQTTLLNSPALRQIDISLHSFESEKAGPALTTYLAEVLAFVQQARVVQPALFINLRLWNRPLLLADARPDPPQEILRQLAAFFELPPQVVDRLAPAGRLTLAPKVFVSLAPPFTWPHAPGPDLGGRGFCRGLRDHVAILVDGTVVPCCLDAEADIVLGNLLNQPFHEILASPRASRMRQGFARWQVVEPLCRRCSYRQRFQPGVGA
ncbi:MAG: hypothetical protein AUK28_03435 [Desulfobacterales bacterium CG2_30_60_27]|nr:MAG: hypothetical protein AUK28_03435 [Desulfobacterales bacterium CG2_30_60_27]